MEDEVLDASAGVMLHPSDDILTWKHFVGTQKSGAVKLSDASAHNNNVEGLNDAQKSVYFDTLLTELDETEQRIVAGRQTFKTLNSEDDFFDVLKDYAYIMAATSVA